MSDAPLCIRCWQPQSKNPHPDAGNLNADPPVGYVWECIPCGVETSLNWMHRAQQAESRLSEAEKIIDRLIDGQSMLCTHWRYSMRPCGECSTCQARAFINKQEAKPGGAERTARFSEQAASGTGQLGDRPFDPSGISQLGDPWEG